MMQSVMNRRYSEKEFKKLDLEMLYALGEPIVSDGSTVYGRGNARFLVNRENSDYVISLNY